MKVYIIISEILMILVQISLRNGLRSALTLSKLKTFSGGACPQTPLVGAASPLRCLRQRYSVCTPFSKYLATPLISPAHLVTKRVEHSANIIHGEFMRYVSTL